tara:strand:+ start:6610 stop:7248 length:639 start_codon:yes stop_codon:yes gene_type:complete
MQTKSVEIELTTRCPIKCPACPRTYRTTHENYPDWNTGHINPETVYKVIDDSYFDSIRFVGSFGDAIYHPNFVDIMAKACNVSKRIKVETNGAHRKPKFWKQVSELPWDNNRIKEIAFSIDGLKDTNHIYRKGSNWDSIMMAVDTLASSKHKPTLIWQMLVFPYNEHQVEEAKSMYKSLGFDEFRSSKSLRKYNPRWFENEQEGRNIDWNYS